MNEKLQELFKALDFNLSKFAPLKPSVDFSKLKAALDSSQFKAMVDHYEAISTITNKFIQNDYSRLYSEDFIKAIKAFSESSGSRKTEIFVKNLAETSRKYQNFNEALRKAIVKCINNPLFK